VKTRSAPESFSDGADEGTIDGSTEIGADVIGAAEFGGKVFGEIETGAVVVPTCARDKGAEALNGAIGDGTGARVFSTTGAVVTGETVVGAPVTGNEVIGDRIIDIETGANVGCGLAGKEE
jgi:hypothetical protein